MSVVFLAERASAPRRGLVSSLATLGANVGTLMGSAMGTLVAALLTPEQLAAWGWRLPFLAGIILARWRSPCARGSPRGADGEAGRLAAAEAVRDHWRDVLQAMAMTVAIGALF